MTRMTSRLSVVRSTGGIPQEFPGKGRIRLKMRHIFLTKREARTISVSPVLIVAARDRQNEVS
jgi:hypothetical protein